MKSTRRAVTAAFALLVMLTPVFGQTAGLRVDVPFKFVVGKTNLRSGRIQSHRDETGDVAVTADGWRVGTASFMTSYTGGGPYQDRRERLVFHTYGDHFFLSQVWIDDVNPGHELYVSAAELEYARTAHQTQTVLVAEGTNTTNRRIVQGSVKPKPGEIRASLFERFYLNSRSKA